jgi:hypothetical protein
MKGNFQVRFLEGGGQELPASTRRTLVPPWTYPGTLEGCSIVPNRPGGRRGFPSLAFHGINIANAIASAARLLPNEVPGQAESSGKVLLDHKGLSEGLSFPPAQHPQFPGGAVIKDFYSRPSAVPRAHWLPRPARFRRWKMSQPGPYSTSAARPPALWHPNRGWPRRYPA